MLPLTHHPEVCYGLLLHCGQYLKLAKCIASIHANCGGRYSKVEHASLHATRQPPQYGRECSDILINMITAYHLFQIRDFQEYMMLEYSFYIGGKGDFEVDK